MKRMELIIYQFAHIVALKHCHSHVDCCLRSTGSLCCDLAVNGYLTVELGRQYLHKSLGLQGHLKFCNGPSLTVVAFMFMFCMHSAVLPA